MHPWMIEQVAREQRRELLARASRPRVRRSWTWRSLASYIGMTRTDRRPARVDPGPSLAPLPGGAAGRHPTAAGPGGQASAA